MGVISGFGGGVGQSLEEFLIERLARDGKRDDLERLVFPLIKAHDGDSAEAMARSTASCGHAPRWNFQPAPANTSRYRKPRNMKVWRGFWMPGKRVGLGFHWTISCLFTPGWQRAIPPLKTGNPMATGISPPDWRRANRSMLSCGALWPARLEKTEKFS